MERERFENSAQEAVELIMRDRARTTEELTMMRLSEVEHLGASLYDEFIPVVVTKPPSNLEMSSNGKYLTASWSEFVGVHWMKKPTGAGRRIIVCGGRDYKDGRRLFEALDELVQAIDTLILGGARGADTLAHVWAKQRGVHYELYPARWDEHGKRAGILRNVEMFDSGCDIIIGFPGGRGTAHMLSLGETRMAKENGVRTIRID